MNNVDGRPLVTIGVPVRNGAATLALALESIRRQTYPTLEVVITDNCSTDATAAIIDRFVRDDERFRAISQAAPISMIQNHAATYREASGDYFMWLAHDDLLTDELVERLVVALECDRGAVLAFGEVELFTDYEHLRDLRRLPHRFATDGVPVWRRLVRNRNSGWEIKGLFRTRALRGYRWWEHTVSPDWPLLTHLLVVGEVIEVPGAVLRVGYEADLKTGDERAARQSYGRIEPLATVTLSWRTARAASDAAAQVGRRRVVVVDFLLVLGGLLWANRRSLAPWNVAAWRSRLYRLLRVRPARSES